ncbi:MAG TPA: hypothetical protein VFP89_06630 [Propionibacteriaceae bacterium]|nr:hypothetical protein [Propionibacteriaceae bacterium]
MAGGSGTGEDRCWQQAVAYALTGGPSDALEGAGLQDLDEVIDALGGPAAILEHRAVHHDQGDSCWPHPVPDDLRQTVGAARLHALVAQAIVRIRAADPARGQPVRSSRPLTADEQRLRRDVPPHHGS